jgi:ParB/RepB/Spo0J family partition protein
LTTPLNLDALDAFTDLDRAGEAGKPLLLDIDTVHEDPDQPRKAFDPAALSELTESIRVSGVKSPVSVRPHPTIAGHYLLNFGARRLRASRAAGLSKIPAFIDEAHTDFEQVVENLQRDGLTPMEMALFIHAKVQSGSKKGEIARRLGISNAAVSKYLVLVEGPEEIEALYSSARCQSPDTLYEVAGLLEKWPAETRSWLDANPEVTRTSIDTLKKALSASTIKPNAEGDGTLPSVRPVPEGVGAGDESQAPGHSRPAIPIRSADVPAVETSRRLRHPILYVSVGKRDGILLLNEMAAKADHIVVRWVGSSQQEEVPTSTVKIQRLAEA